MHMPDNIRDSCIPRARLKVGDTAFIGELQLMFARDGERATAIVNSWARAGGSTAWSVLAVADDVCQVELTQIVVPLAYKPCDLQGHYVAYVPVAYHGWV